MDGFAHSRRFWLVSGGGPSAAVLDFLSEEFVAKTSLLGRLATYPNRPDSPTLGAHVALWSDEIEGDWRKAIEAGALVVSPLSAKPQGQVSGYLRDADGIVVELCAPNPREMPAQALAGHGQVSRLPCCLTPRLSRGPPAWVSGAAQLEREAAGFISLEINLVDWHLLFYEALVYGLVLSLVLTILLMVSGAIALDMFVSDYPPDIKQKYGPMSPRAARLRPFIATLLFITVLVVPLIGLFALQAKVRSVPFLPALVFSEVTLLVFNLFDLIVLDWILFCTIQPRAMVLPGTEGMAGYRDYRFHFIGFLKGLGFSAVGGLLIATFWIALPWLISLLPPAA